MIVVRSQWEISGFDDCVRDDQTSEERMTWLLTFYFHRC
jgi:hypothetical protein